LKKIEELVLFKNFNEIWNISWNTSSL
jgi:hypothetical protein